MESQPHLSPDTLQRETSSILEKLQGTNIPHVESAEREAAVRRAVMTVGAKSALSVQVLIELIATNEAALAVHSAPSDVDA